MRRKPLSCAITYSFKPCSFEQLLHATWQAWHRLLAVYMQFKLGVVGIEPLTHLVRRKATNHLPLTLSRLFSQHSMAQKFTFFILVGNFCKRQASRVVWIRHSYYNYVAGGGNHLCSRSHCREPLFLNEEETPQSLQLILRSGIIHHINLIAISIHLLLGAYLHSFTLVSSKF